MDTELLFTDNGDSRIHTEVPGNITYGRILEGVHLNGYTASRVCVALEQLLENDGWKHVGGGFNDINSFLESINLSQFKIQVDQRKSLARKLSALEASHRAIAKVFGVSHQTIGRAVSGPQDSASPNSDSQVVTVPVVIHPHSESVGPVGSSGPPQHHERHNPLDVDGDKVLGFVERKADRRDKVEQAQARKAHDDDYTPDPTIRVKHGQRWRCGNHLVICDSALNVLPTIQYDAIVTDPPYGIDYKPSWNKWDGSDSTFARIAGDDKPFDPTPFLSARTVVLFGANYYSALLPLGGWLCWDKRTKEELDGMFGSPFELAWYRSATTSRKTIMVRILHGGVVNADSETGNNDKRHHPTQKPIALMREVVHLLTAGSDVVLDPFAGSGSTLLACEIEGRACVAVEIEPGYASLIIDRWEHQTGGVACLE